MVSTEKKDASATVGAEPVKHSELVRTKSFTEIFTKLSFPFPIVIKRAKKRINIEPVMTT